MQGTRNGLGDKMKWDKRYENAQIGFRDNFLQIVRGLFKEKCYKCRARTYWKYYTQNKSYPCCSGECLEKLKNETTSTF